MTDELESYPPCRCGREMRKLNVASDDPKCVGCGQPSDECRCSPTHERRQQLKGRYGGMADLKQGEDAHA